MEDHHQWPIKFLEYKSVDVFVIYVWILLVTTVNEYHSLPTYTELARPVMVESVNVRIHTLYNTR